MAKEFTWKGKTEEELKNMDLEQFKELTTSRQRSVIEARIYRCAKSIDKRIAAGDNNVKTHYRDLVIIPRWLVKLCGFTMGRNILWLLSAHRW